MGKNVTSDRVIFLGHYTHSTQTGLLVTKVSSAKSSWNFNGLMKKLELPTQSKIYLMHNFTQNEVQHRLAVYGVYD